MKKKIFSGIQPTGELHFGNYFGAIQNWVRLQADYDCTFMVVNYHAITMPYEPELLRQNTWNLAFSLLALGVKAENLCIQSLVPEHTELCWILNSFCSFGELQRMTQFKDKSELLEDTDKTAFVSAGLFDYPVLQAADIIIYGAEYVPVGKDQEQHLELARNIAERFNHRVGKDICVVPKPLFTEIPKVMSLADPTRKMSKSLGEKHYVSVFEDEKSLTKKVKTAVTDAGDDVEAPMSAGVKNLFGLLRAAGAQSEYDALMNTYTSGVRRYGDLKNAVAVALSALTADFRARRQAIIADQDNYREQIFEAGAQKRKIAQNILAQIRETAGLIAPK
jgi:tryptophanyl-tRNA synthetase